jgi:hypothetical protein
VRLHPTDLLIKQPLQSSAFRIGDGWIKGAYLIKQGCLGTPVKFVPPLGRLLRKAPHSLRDHRVEIRHSAKPSRAEKEAPAGRGDLVHQRVHLKGLVRVREVEIAAQGLAVGRSRPNNI